MALKGNLRDFSATQLLNLVNLAGKSGTLTVERKDQKIGLAFRDGKLIASSLGDSDGSLAAVLAETGKLTRQQAEAIRERARQTGDKQVGLVLIHAGYVTQEDIVFSIRRHAVRTLQEFATWQEGAFQFEDGRLPGDDRITVPLDFRIIIIEVARLQQDRQIWLEDLPSLDVALKFKEQPATLLKGLQLSPEEWKVINFVNPSNTIRRIAQTLNMKGDQIRRIVYGLRQAGLVEVVKASTPDKGGYRPPVTRSQLESIIQKIRSR